MKISIIMCVMNSMPYIMASIESFNRQKYKNKELIIVHTKSNDNTDEYLNSVNNKNIKKFYFNGKIYKSLNYGIKQAKGDLIGMYFEPKTGSLILKEVEPEDMLQATSMVREKSKNEQEYDN